VKGCKVCILSLRIQKNQKPALVNQKKKKKKKKKPAIYLLLIKKKKYLLGLCL
jgi:adenine-specific DNA glycosylase